MTDLGDRLKSYEKAYSARAMPLLPVIARLDGKNFSRWTLGLDKPFDKDFMGIMQDITAKLVSETNAVVGYTQSDEITLVLYSGFSGKQIFFDGKLQKITSVLSSMCTALFNKACTYDNYTAAKSALFKAKPPALFDCRVFQVPTLDEAVNCLIWREQDASRNSILSVAQSKFTHGDLYRKNTAEINEMLYQKDGTNWAEDYTSAEKRGSYFKKVKRLEPFTATELQDLPLKHQARNNPSLVTERSEVKRIKIPPLAKIINRVECIFESANPITNFFR